MAGEKKPFPYGSYIIAHCPECGAPAYVVCTLCKKGVCQEHSMYLASHPCINRRSYHDDSALRLVQDSGFVKADEVVFFS